MKCFPNFRPLIFGGLFIFFSHVFLLQGQSITISGNPGTLTISSAVAGQQPTSAVDSSTTYGVVAPLVVRSVIGRINSNMPTNTTLSVQLAPPSGATSAGSVSMNTTNKTLVSGIPILTSVSGLTVTYTFAATVAAAQVTNGTRTLTLTIQ